MPRRTTPTSIEAILALSPAATARALGVRTERVKEAIRDRKLIVRKLGMKHRIAVFGKGGIQEWFESWPEVTPREVPKC
jgi:hypothetical protein